MSELLLSVLTGGDSAIELAPRQWEQLLRDARATMLTARLAAQAAEEGWIDRVPLRPRRHLEAAQRVCASQQHMVRWEIDQIERALKDLPCPILLLKGAAYVMAGSAAAAGRVFSDIDIMVPREWLAAAEAALIAQGWISNVSGYDRRYYEEWMHELPPLQHVRRASVIDLHHTIAPPVGRIPVDGAKLFAAARPLAGTKFAVLSPTDMVLHSALHLLQEGDLTHGLRDLIDLDRLFRAFGSDAAFWPSLIARAAELGLGRPLYYAVDQAAALLGTPMPDTFKAAVDAYRPFVLAREAFHRLLATALVGSSAGASSRAAALSRTVLSMRGHYMRMPLRLLVPHLIRKSGVRLASLATRTPAASMTVGGEETAL